MAAKKVYVPCFLMGDDGERAYEFIELTGVLVTGVGKAVPEGECMISSRVVQSTPPVRLQPKGNRPAPPGAPGP